MYVKNLYGYGFIIGNHLKIDSRRTIIFYQLSNSFRNKYEVHSNGT